MMPVALQKITTGHLQRQAMLYVRQSSLHQVLENTESTARQYALQERAVALGWQPERIVIIDQDLPSIRRLSGGSCWFSAAGRRSGIGAGGPGPGAGSLPPGTQFCGLASLLEICALTGTLILDEDGLYDPAAFNDRLLLGLKGAMSEAELHVLRARLQGGIRELCAARGVETALAHWAGLRRR